MTTDYYAILSVPRDAKPPQIKARFRELARDRHPDRFSGREKQAAELEFQAITEAFNVLMDPMRRRQHDLELDRPLRRSVYDPGEAVRVYMNRGVRAYKARNFAEAAANFERAVQADPDNPRAWHHLALASSKEKRWQKKAQEAIGRACELRPNWVPYLKLAGKIYAAGGMAPRARQYYNQALSVGGPDPSIRKALAALGEAPAKSEAKKKPSGLFRKMW